jgi:hypothetical protein
MDEAGGWLWLVIDVGLVAILGVALFYGMSQYRKRRLDPQRDQKTRELYKTGDKDG